MGINEKAWKVGFKWTKGDASNPTGAIAVDATSKALHIARINDIATDWNVAVNTNPTLYIHSATNPATEYATLDHDATDLTLNIWGGNLKLALGGTDKITLTSSALSPSTSDGNALGTTLLMWSDLFLASGGVINFNSGDVTITHSANALAFAGVTGDYTFDDSITPATNDGAGLGSSAKKFSDLYLASGAVINFNNADVILTHSSDLLTLAGGGLTVTAGQFISGAPIKQTITTKTAEATLTAAESGIILVNADNVTVYLPTYVSNAGLTYTIKALASYSAGVYVNPNGSETVDGAATKKSTGQYDALTVTAGPAGSGGYYITGQKGTWS